MSTTFIAFDRRSGKILSVHHGMDNETVARMCCAQHHAELKEDQIAIITALSEAVEQGKQYKVDVSCNELIEVATNEKGVSFGFGEISSTKTD